MNIKKLLETQKALDDRIRKEKGLEGQDLTANTFLALLVELGEMANCWREFKFWSNDQAPRYERKCHACKGKGKFENKDICLYCEGTGIEAKPLLEEYIDCLHFFLSLGLKKFGIEKADIIMDFDCRIEEYDEYREVVGNVSFITELFRKVAQAESGTTLDFVTAWRMFITLGLYEFYFHGAEIEEAYYRKNQINHARQENGY